LLRFLIADDHAVVRQGLKQILLEEFPDASFGEATNGAEILGLLKQQEWDVVTLDISLPGRSGLEVLKEAREKRPHLKVLVLSMHPEEQYAVRALKAGAAGYLTKQTAPEELVNAVKKILSGGKYVSAALAEKLASALGAPSDRPPHETLSDREYQVFCLIASGKTTGQIAEELNLSVQTISTYRARVLEKMAMSTNAELTRYAIQNGLVL
jgi:DNA-binding NarL/FixJ family response regulator